MPTKIKHLKLRKSQSVQKVGISLINVYCSFDVNKRNLSLARRRFDKVCALDVKPKISKITDYKIDSVPVREYIHSPDSPYLVYFHGGGYVLEVLKVMTFYADVFLSTAS